MKQAKKSALVIIAAMGLWSGPTELRAAVRLSLDDCIRIATGESPDLKANALQYEADEQTRRFEQASLFPKFTGSIVNEILQGQPLSPFSALDPSQPVDVTSSNGRNTTTRRQGQDRVIFFNTPILLTQVSVAYPLFQDGSILGLNDAPAVKAVKFKKEQTRQLGGAIAEEVIQKVTNAYWSACFAYEKVALDRETEEVNRKRVEAISLEIELRLRSKIELGTAKSRLEAASAALKNSLASEESARRSLGSLLNLEKPADIEVRGTTMTLSDLPPLKSFLGPTVERHPTVLAQQAGADAAGQTARKSKFNLYPEVTFNASYNYIDDYSPPGNDLTIALVKVEIPIWDFGAGLAQYREKKKLAEVETMKKEVASKEIREQLEATYAQLLQARTDLLTQREAVRNLDLAYSTVAAEQDVGMSRAMPVFDAKLALLDGKRKLQNQFLSYHVLLAQLRNATGGLWKPSSK